MAYIVMSYNLMNGTVNDATQVAQNFTDIVNGLSTGTKDINVSTAAVGTLNATTGNLTTINASTVSAAVGATVKLLTNMAWNTTMPDFGPTDGAAIYYNRDLLRLELIDYEQGTRYYFNMTQI
jgi:hypothetical protein